MQVIKKSLASVPRQDAHGGSGARRLYLHRGELRNPGFEALTYGYLPAKSKFSWHFHDTDIEEVCLVLKGHGIHRDHEGDYEYAPGDLFVCPVGIEHEIENPTDEEHEFIFVRL